MNDAVTGSDGRAPGMAPSARRRSSSSAARTPVRATRSSRRRRPTKSATISSTGSRPMPAPGPSARPRAPRPRAAALSRAPLATVRLKVYGFAQFDHLLDLSVLARPKENYIVEAGNTRFWLNVCEDVHLSFIESGYGAVMTMVNDVSYNRRLGKTTQTIAPRVFSCLCCRFCSHFHAPKGWFPRDGARRRRDVHGRSDGQLLGAYLVRVPREPGHRNAQVCRDP